MCKSNLRCLNALFNKESDSGITTETDSVDDSPYAAVIFCFMFAYSFYLIALLDSFSLSSIELYRSQELRQHMLPKCFPSNIFSFC